MKNLLAVLCLVASSSAQYPAHGWRPDGPGFDLPQRVPQSPQQPFAPVDPRNRTPFKQQAYLPPEPRQPNDVDLSVQGLPQQEPQQQQVTFQLSPINGQQYVGPDFNADIMKLDAIQGQTQAQNQQNIYRQFSRQRQLDAQRNNNPNGLPNTQTPRQFSQRPVQSTVPTQTTLSTAKSEPTTETTTTEATLNEGETLNDNKKVTVEVTKQNIQAFPPELYLNPIAQLKLQPQLVPLQFGQLRSPYQDQEQESRGYDANVHFAAFPSVLAQQQSAQGQQTPVSPQPMYLVPQDQSFGIQSQYPYQNTQVTNQVPQTIQPQPQFNIQAQPVFTQTPVQETPAGQVPQVVYQYQPQDPTQPQVYQPQEANQYAPAQPQVYQLQGLNPQYDQPQVFQQQPVNQYQTPQLFQPQEANQAAQYNQLQLQLFQQQQANQANQYNQLQFFQQQVQNQGQDALQSGLDVNKEANELDETDDSNDENQNDGATATAVATAFGARTQPRVNTKYGAPLSPRTQDNDYQTKAADEADAEDSQSVAASTPRGGRRRSSKYRSRQARPMFTLDKTGHLVLAQEQ